MNFQGDGMPLPLKWYQANPTADPKGCSPTRIVTKLKISKIKVLENEDIFKNVKIFLPLTQTLFYEKFLKFENILPKLQFFRKLFENFQVFKFSGAGEQFK